MKRTLWVSNPFDETVKMQFIGCIIYFFKNDRANEQNMKTDRFRIYIGNIIKYRLNVSTLFRKAIKLLFYINEINENIFFTEFTLSFFSCWYFLFQNFKNLIHRHSLLRENFQSITLAARDGS